MVDAAVVAAEVLAAEVVAAEVVAAEVVAAEVVAAEVVAAEVVASVEVDVEVEVEVLVEVEVEVDVEVEVEVLVEVASIQAKCKVNGRLKTYCTIATPSQWCVFSKSNSHLPTKGLERRADDGHKCGILRQRQAIAGKQRLQ